MNTILSLALDPTLASTLTADGALKDRQIDSLTTSDQIIARLTAEPSQIDALVIGPAADEPVRLTQRAHAIAHDLPVVILGTEAQCQQIREAMRFAPLVGRDISYACTVSPAEVSETVRLAADRAHRRRTARQTAAAMNQSLAQTRSLTPRASEYLGQLLDHAPIGVITLDGEMTIRGWNVRAQRIFERSERDMLGQPLWSLFDAPERDRLRQSLADVLQPGGQMDAAVFNRTASGDQAQYLEISAVSMQSDEARSGLMVLIQDVTARERAEEGRNKAEESLRQQRRWFEATLLSIGDAVIATDAEGRITLMNAMAEQLTGWSFQDAFGRDSHDVFNIVNHTTRKAVASPVDRVLREGVLVGLANHTLLIARDGTERPIDDSGSPIRDREGRLVGVVLVFRDISERYQTEQALRASQEHLRLITESVRDYAIFTMDLQGRVTSWNRGAEQIFGYTEAEVLGQSGDIILTPEERQAGVPAAEMNQALESGRADDDRWQMRKDGSRFWVNGVMAALRDGNGNVQGFVKVLRDQSEAKRSWEQLEARARQQAAVAAFGQKALAGTDLQALFDETVAIVSQTLDNELCKVLRLLPDGKHLQLEAGVGWQEGLVGRGRVGSDLNSQAGYTLMSDQPVVVTDLKQETRFSGPPLLHDHRVVSGMSVVIAGGADGAWGVLGTHSRRRREYSQDDVNFLQAMANILATAIQRQQAEQRLQQLNETLEQRVAERTADAERRAGQLQAMATELSRTEERERRRLAEVLHDHLQQLLAASKLQVDLLSKRAHDPKLDPVFNKVIDLLSQSLETSRDLTVELSPPILYESGLVPALQWLSRWMQEKHELTVHLKVEGSVELTDEDLRILVFQSLRELLFNCVKYADVPEARVDVRRRDAEHLEFKVADKGKGFDLNRTSEQREGKEGFGLFSIRERLELMGGTMKVWSKPGEGTRVTLVVPVRRRRLRGGAPVQASKGIG